MTKTFIKIRKRNSLRPRRRGNRNERKKSKNKKSEINPKFKNISSAQPSSPPPILDVPQYEDNISKFNKARIEFLFAERDNTLNDYFLRETEEFELNMYIQKENTNERLQKIRNFLLYSLLDIKAQITTIFNYTFPANFVHSVIALFDLFLARSNKEMDANYAKRIMNACMDIIDKKEGLGVFINKDFKKTFTPDDEVDILEATDLEIDPVKPYDYFSLFYFNSHVSKRNNVLLLNYIESFKKLFDKVAFCFLFNLNTKKNKPSTNYMSIFLITYELTKNFVPSGDNYINEYINDFKKRINYEDEFYLLAKMDYLKGVSLVEKTKLLYEEALKK